MLNVLIVEDDGIKLQKITKALSDVEGFEMSGVSRAGDVNAAKILLKQIHFDLLILDIALPPRMDQEVKSDSGIKLLDEITERPGYKIPTHIIGITGYPEILEVAAERFSKRVLTVLYYEPSSDNWAIRLQTKTRHIISSKVEQQTGTVEYKSHLAVVCALESPELSSVLQLNWSWKQTHVPNDDTIYYQGEFFKNDERKVVHAAASARMGMPAASILTMKMISAFRPEYLAMVGITAGVPGKTHYGDIIGADPSWDWGSGKWEVRDNVLHFLPSPHQIPLSSSIRNKLRLFGKDDAALLSIRRSWPGDMPSHELALRVGPMASGAAVLADGLTIDRIKQQHRELLAIEMETYGVFAAVEEATEPRPSVFSMKAVVDFGDGSKNDQFQKYAAYMSAQGVKHFVENYL